MSDFSWVETGFDSPADPRPAKLSDQTFRFRLPQGGRANVVLLSGTNEFYKVRQHEIWPPGSHPVYVTCCQTEKVDCPVCKAAKDTNNKKLLRSEFWIGTVLDLDGYEKDGKKVGVGRRLLFPIKSKTKQQLQEVFMTCMDEGWTIKGGKFLISRSKDERSARVGDTFQAVPGFDLEKWAKKARDQGLDINLEPFKIPEMEEFKPSLEACNLALANAGLGGTTASAETSGGGDFTSQVECPFDS